MQRNREEGQAIVELALVTPIIFTFFLGALAIGWLLLSLQSWEQSVATLAEMRVGYDDDVAMFASAEYAAWESDLLDGPPACINPAITEQVDGSLLTINLTCNVSEIVPSTSTEHTVTATALIQEVTPSPSPQP